MWCVFHICERIDKSCYLHCRSDFSDGIADGSIPAVCSVHMASSLLFSVFFLSLWTTTFKQQMSLSVFLPSFCLVLSWVCVGSF